MLRGLFMIAGAIIVAGLGIALLNAFNWDIAAVFTWAWNGISTLVSSVAEFFTGNPTFQQIVSS